LLLNLAVKSSTKEKQAMKKILVVVLVVAIALIGVTAAFAGNHMTMSCRVCHTPHHANATPPLWDPTAGDWGAATGSNVCIACHDGTYTMGGLFDVYADGAAANHPVGAGAGYGAAGTDATIVGTGTVTYLGGVVECQSCHFVHLDSRQTGSYYVRTSTGAATFCQSCHHLSW
jgi:hypothetical protein